MATATGTNVKFVKVQTKQQYTDYTDKDGALIFVENERKIYVDGIAYGFSDSDVANKFVKLTGDTMTGSLKIGNTANNTVYESNRILLNHTDGLPRFIKPVAGGLVINIAGTTYEFGENLFVMGGDESVRIGGVADPISGGDAVNLEYLNTEVIDKIGVENGIASLNELGQVPSTQLPSYVDDILEYSNRASFPDEGESGKLYLAIDTGDVWRWSGSVYIRISDGSGVLVLGTTASTAYRGDRGQAAFDHSNVTGNPHGVTAYDIDLGSVENYGIATDVEAKEGTVGNKYMTPLRTKEAIETLAPKLSWEVVS